MCGMQKWKGRFVEACVAYFAPRAVALLALLVVGLGLERPVIAALLMTAVAGIATIKKTQVCAQI
jgi:hypothetical protein